MGQSQSECSDGQGPNECQPLGNKAEQVRQKAKSPVASSVPSLCRHWRWALSPHIGMLLVLFVLTNVLSSLELPFSPLSTPVAESMTL